jgi:hypothetical protein
MLLHTENAHSLSIFPIFNIPISSLLSSSIKVSVRNGIHNSQPKRSTLLHIYSTIATYILIFEKDSGMCKIKVDMIHSHILNSSHAKRNQKQLL